MRRKTLKRPRKRTDPTVAVPAKEAASPCPVSKAWSAGALDFEVMKLRLAKQLSRHNTYYTLPIPEEDGTYAPCFPSIWMCYD